MSSDRSLRSVVAPFCVVALFAGCSGSRDGATSRAQGALAATASAPIDLETWSNDANVTLALASSHDLACNTGGCLALYTLSLPFRTPATYLYGTRLDAAAVPLDSPRIFYGPAASFGGLATFGADFLAVWTIGSTPHAARLDGTTGAVVQDLSSLLPTGSNHHVSSGTAGALLTYDSGGTTYALVLDAATMAAVGTPIALPAGGPAVAASPGQFLLAWSQRFMRIDATTGAALDATPLVYTQYYPGTPKVVYVGGVYQLVWELQDSIYAARIRPSDGVVLDADTSAAAGAKQICDQCIGDFSCDPAEQQTLGLGASGTRAYVTYLALTNGCGATSGLHGYTIDPSTGLGGDAWSFTYQGGGLNDGNHNAVAQPTFRTTSAGALIMLDQAFAQVPHVAASTGNLSAGTVQQVVKALPTRARVRVIASKGQYLVGWQTTTTTVGGPLVAARIDAAGGKLLDATPLSVNDGGVYTRTFAGASDGTDYLLAYGVVNNTFSRRFIRHDGTVSIVLPTAINMYQPTSDPYQGLLDIALAYNGAEYLLAWTQEGIKFQFEPFVALDTFGNPLSTGSSNLDATFFTMNALGQPRVWLVPDATPNASPRNFLMLLEANESGLFASIPPASGTYQTVSAPFFTDRTTSFLAGAGSGATAFSANASSGTTPTQVTLFDSATATAHGGFPKTPSLCATCRIRAAWSDGTDYVAAVEDTATEALTLTGYQNDLSPETDGSGAVTVTPQFGGLDGNELVAGASDQSGRSLVAYQEESPEQAGFVLRAMLVNRGASSGAGGAGGAAGSTGVAGNGAAGASGASGTAGGSGAAGHGPGGGGGTNAAGANGAAGSGGRAGASGTAGSGGAAGTNGTGGAGGVAEMTGTAGAAGGHAGSIGATGGTTGAAGARGTGGAKATGGGGGTAAGAAGATGGSTTGGGSSGCSCDVPGSGTSPGALLFSLLGLALVHRRRRLQRPSCVAPGPLTPPARWT